MLILTLLFGCPSPIMPLYDEHKAEALADPGPAPRQWKPDALFTIHNEAVARIVKRALNENGTLTDSFTAAGATLSPTLRVDQLALDSKNCSGCLNVALTLRGDMDWRFLAASGNDLPITVKADLTVDLTTQKTGDQWVAHAKPTKLRSISFESDRISRSLQKVAEGPLENWVRNKFLERVKPIEIGTFGSNDVPIRGARFIETDVGIRIAILTASPTPSPIPINKPKLREGWLFEISQDSLVDLARAQAFEAGVQDYDVVVEPSTLAFRGGTFTLGMRVWRLKGKGWWRDYEAKGTYTLKKKRVVLEPDSVEELDQSKGAVLVDPLAALAEGILLNVISDTLATSIPTKQASDMGDTRVSTRLTGLFQTGEVISLMGPIDLKKAQR